MLSFEKVIDTGNTCTGTPDVFKVEMVRGQVRREIACDLTESQANNLLQAISTFRYYCGDTIFRLPRQNTH